MERLQEVKEQLETSRQQAAILDSDFRAESSGHELTKAELQNVRQEVESLRAGLADAQKQCSDAQSQLQVLQSQRPLETVNGIMKTGLQR